MARQHEHVHLLKKQRPGSVSVDAATRFQKHGRSGGGTDGSRDFGRGGNRVGFQT